MELLQRKAEKYPNHFCRYITFDTCSDGEYARMALDSVYRNLRHFVAPDEFQLLRGHAMIGGMKDDVTKSLNHDQKRGDVGQYLVQVTI